MRRVLLVNEGGLGNIGDEAIRRCLEHLLEARGCHVEWTAFSRGAPTQRLPAQPGRTHNRRLKRFLKMLVPASLAWLVRHGRSYIPYARRPAFDLAVIGGGQLLQSNGVFALAMFLWVCALKRARSQRIVVLAVGAAEQFTPLDRALLGWSLRRVDAVYVRDRASAAVVQRLFGVAAEWCPDPAFCITDVFPASFQAKRSALLCPVDYGFYRRKCPAGARLSEQAYCEYWLSAAQRFLSAGYDVRLFCTSKHQDLHFAQRLRQRLVEQCGLAVEIDGADTLDTICKLIESAEVVVAARMHALIIAHAFGRRVLPFRTSEKIAAFEREYLQDPGAATAARQRVNTVVDQLLRAESAAAAR
jgi:polysaccharide pyruvyl transferase WcaK-like protein